MPEKIAIAMGINTLISVLLVYPTICEYAPAAKENAINGALSVLFLIEKTLTITPRMIRGLKNRK